MIERIRRALGISCVEIYLLALFERHNVDRNEVFMESYIPLHRLISDFTENVQTNFASYAGLERVQSIAAVKRWRSFQICRARKIRLFNIICTALNPNIKTRACGPGGTIIFCSGMKENFTIVIRLQKFS